ncbi:MAG: transporter related [Ilumatobacteraceae bacterium]|nr:transporter related [Ilumatobacteraceae bacterium]
MSSGLDLVGLSAGYGSVEAMHDVTVSFPLGTVVAVLGHNGAGKSTLMRITAGTLTPVAGRVRWRGADITTWTAHERAVAGIASVPDEPNVFADMTVAENLDLVAGDASHDVVFEAFPTLAERKSQLAGTLSGGERQQLALGCVLLRPGSAILVDELSHGLSAAALDRAVSVLTDMAGPDRVIVVVEPDHPEALRRVDLVYVLSRGRLTWAGEPSELGRGLLPTSG